MRLRRTRSVKDQLDASFERVKNIDQGSLELRADFARYLCVQVSGFLEQSVRNTTAAYAEKRAHPSVSNFVIQASNRLMNLDAEKIRGHFLKFDSNWQDDLEGIFTGEAKDAINSVVALRNRIAHGEAADITIARVSRYFNEVVEVVKKLEILLDVGD